MILEFLKGELNSKRFNGSLDNIINDLGLDSSIIFNGNIKNKKENLDRLNIMKKFRGYPDNGLFENFPKISEWKYLELDEKDILFGPVLRKQKDPLFIEKWERELKIQRRILDSLNTEHEKYAKVLHSIALIEEVL